MSGRGAPSTPGPRSPRGPAGYRVLRALSRLLLTLFYRRVEVVGRERVPADGPLVITANHQNALVDPMLVMAAVPRPLVILAAAPLFGNPVVGPLLRLVGALPVLRRQEGIAERSRNDALFDAVAAALRRDGAVLLFPEGRTQPEPVLLPLRTGAARILLAAADEGRRAGLLPVGLVFREPGAFRTGQALVLIGEPVALGDLAALHRTEPERAVRELTARLSEALRARIVEADDRETLRLMRLVEAIWPGSRAGQPEAARVAALQEVSRAHRVLRERAPDRLDAFRRAVESFRDDLDRAGLGDGEIAATYRPGAVLRWTLVEALPLVLSLPLAACGIALHGLPYQATALVVRALRPRWGEEEEATYKILAGAVLYPLFWIGEAALLWWLGGPWALAAFAVALLPTGFFALAWQERVARARRDAGAFFRFLLHRDLRRRLIARRQALAAELVELADLAAEPAAPGGSGSAP